MSGETVDEAGQQGQFRDWPQVGQVCRLGLATRGNTSLEPEDVEHAVDQGINYLNWCRHEDGLQEWIRQSGFRREQFHVAVQFFSRSASEARDELSACLDQLGTDYIDVVTYYYVESESEWEQIVSTGGAAEAVEAARADGVVRSIGLTSHQRSLAAGWAGTGRLDSLMIRYNAAHRGAERDVFPEIRGREIPVVAFTCLRWGGLLKSTPDDPDGFRPPSAADCYRWVLCQPAVSVALAAPDGREELDEILSIVAPWQELSPLEQAAIRDHGDRVYRHGGGFP
ncbi:MAG: aldo/keto reductase [Planctomycetota bacterium]|nr:aldo/keto reductase [Planctomycetota bacterium]